jgi:hypothetical protein
MKKIGILLYSIFAVLALKRVIRNMGTFRKNYIARRTGNQHVVKVHVRLLVLLSGMAYLLSERTILIQAFPRQAYPKVTSTHLVINSMFRANTARFVLDKFCRIYNTLFGDHYYFRCYMSAYTNKSDDDSARIAQTLKKYHYTKEAFLLRYPRFRADIEKIVDWFEHESLSEPVKMEAV